MGEVMMFVTHLQMVQKLLLVFENVYNEKIGTNKIFIKSIFLSFG